MAARSDAAYSNTGAGAAYETAGAGATFSINRSRRRVDDGRLRILEHGAGAAYETQVLEPRFHITGTGAVWWRQARAPHT